MKGQNATLPAYLLSKSINELGGTWRLLHEKKNKVWRKESKKAKRACTFIGDFRVLSLTFRKNE